MELPTTIEEAEILIALLTAAEGLLPLTAPDLVPALAVLRPWRSQLMGTLPARAPHRGRVGDSAGLLTWKPGGNGLPLRPPVP